jgi:hypothetical protein
MDDNNAVRMKRCSKCKGEYPATTEYFSSDKYRPDGLTNQCRICRRKNSQRWRENNPEKVEAQNREYYWEHREELLEANRKWHAENQEKRRESHRAWYEKNAEHSKAKRKAWYRANKAHVKAYDRQRYILNTQAMRERSRLYRLANPDKVRETSRRWREANPERVRERDRRRYWRDPEKRRQYVRNWRARHPEYASESARRWHQNNLERAKEICRQWRAANPEKVLLLHQRRKARVKSLPFTLTKEEWVRTLTHWESCCAYCGEKLETVTIDHYIPVSHPECPGTIATNCVPACLSCNASKNNKDAAAWLTRQYGVDRALEIVSRIHAYFASLKSEDRE